MVYKDIVIGQYFRTLGRHGTVFLQDSTDVRPTRLIDGTYHALVYERPVEVISEEQARNATIEARKLFYLY